MTQHIDTEAIRSEMDILNNDKRKGRAFLDVSLRATLRALEDRDRELQDLRNRNRALAELGKEDKRKVQTLGVLLGLFVVAFFLSVVLR